MIGVWLQRRTIGGIALNAYAKELVEPGIMVEAQLRDSSSLK